ncbi:MAG: ParB N-terminal domain-containing protein [Sedimentisphaerales bacterium]|nr:ParB N-terminal domain-containing protein [Sedimentisphaerales bacterium]
MVPIETIEVPTPGSDAQDVKQLAQSIHERRLLQPILVTRTDSGRYRIVAGQLRFEACRELNWRTVPVCMLPTTDNRTVPARGCPAPLIAGEERIWQQRIPPSRSGFTSGAPQSGRS